MAEAAYYREEAARCRRQAAASPDSEAAARWLSLASDYEQLAEALEMAPPMQRVPMQQQPMQQQQSKSTKSDKDD